MLDPELNIPFDVWDEDDVDLQAGATPDSYFPNGVVFNSYQLAIQSTLELLGTRISPIPVIMPVTASPDTVAAVLRSGAAPVLLDVDYLTLQMNATQLQDALQELESAIVLLTMPGGQAVNEGLITLVEDLPTVVDTRLVPDPKDLKQLGSFTVYDLGPMCGAGGVVVHKFLPQLAELKVVRSGSMGHSGKLSWPQTHYIEQRVDQVASRKQDQALNAFLYTDALRASNKSGMIVFKHSLDWPYYLVRVPNAAHVVAHLQEQGIRAVFGCYPLHLVDELKPRWTEAPEYPVAEKLKDEIVALPTWFDPQGDSVKKIIGLMLEVCE